VYCSPEQVYSRIVGGDFDVGEGGEGDEGDGGDVGGFAYGS